MIGRDFNAWTGRLGERRGEEEKEIEQRKSKDGKVNKERKKLIRGIERVRWKIFNGTIEG